MTTNTATAARLNLHAPAPTPTADVQHLPADYRALLRLRHHIPTDILTDTLEPIFETIDLHTLAARGTRLARRTDTASAAELATITRVLTTTLAAPTAPHVTATITALHTDPNHTHRTADELLMLAYHRLLHDPAVVGAPPPRAAH